MSSSATIDIPAVVINLAHSRDRRAHMEAQLKGRGLDYQFFPAVDGYALTDAEKVLYDEQTALAWMRRTLHKQEIGCALSHIRAYEWMIKENLPRLLIMEDDITLKEDFFIAMREWDAWVPRDWAIVNMGTAANYPFSFLAYLVNRVGPQLFPLPSLPTYTLMYCLNITHSTLCYVLSRAAAERLLTMAYPIHLPADDLIGRIAWHRLTTYATLPSLIWTHNLRSIIRVDQEPFILADKKIPYAPQARRRDRQHGWRRIEKYIRLAFSYRRVRRELFWRALSYIGQILNTK